MADASGFTKILFSPPVIIAGVAIGGLLLLSGMGKGASASPSGPSSATTIANLNSITAQNEAAMSTQVALAQVSAGAGSAKLGADVQEQGQILGFLANLNNNNTVLNNAIITSQAGITNNQITTNAATTQDISTNLARLGTSYESAQSSEAQSAAQVLATQAQANAAQNIALTQALGSGFNTLVTQGAKVATAGGF